MPSNVVSPFWVSSPLFAETVGVQNEVRILWTGDIVGQCASLTIVVLEPSLGRYKHDRFHHQRSD